MVQDSLKGGPRGSSDQAAWMAPMVLPITNLDNVAGTLAGVNFDASAGNQTGVIVPPTPGTTWQLDSIIFRITETYGAIGGLIQVGTANVSGIVDDDAFVNDYQIPNASAYGTSITVPLNGDGASLSTGNFAVTPDQWIRLFETGGASAGRYVAYGVFFAVGGTRYSS
jgi:hypothetical protein